MPKGAAHQHKEPSLPQITSIDQIETILPRYVWLDEDDNQVSPIHKELRSAFNFVNGWQDRWDRLVEQHGDPEDPESDFRFQKRYTQMTRSGKPPIKLKRLSIEIKINEPTDEEQQLASVMLGRK